MMAERLAEIRDMAQYAPWGSLPMVRELLDHITQLEAQRGGAVVVPAWDVNAFALASVKSGTYAEGDLRDALKNAELGYNFAVSRIQSIPADRVLTDGMVGADRDRLAAYEELWDMARIRCRTTTEEQYGEQWRKINALRSAKGEVEG